MTKTKKKSNKTLYILLGVLVAVLLFAFIGSKAGFIGGKKKIEVQIAKASENTVIEKVSASGMIQPVTEVTMSPDVPGEIIQLSVQEGDSVHVGDFLAKIRPDNWINARERAEAALNQQRANLASARAALGTAEANLERAEADFQRQKRLWDDKVISEAEWQQAQQAYQAAQNDMKSAQQQVVASQFIVQSSIASLDEAKENVRLTSVIAPMTGIVSKLSVEKGERVVGTSQMAGTEMMRIADLDSMEVRVDVNENDIIRVSVGDTAIIDVDAYSFLEREFKGIVTAIANSANAKASPDAVTEFEVRITILKNSYRDLIEKGNRYPFRPGMTASVDIITERRENILTVPLSAVTTRNPNEDESQARRRSADSDMEGDEEDEEDSENDEMTEQEEEQMEEVIFVVKEGEAEMRLVKTGISDYENIQILEGVEKGEEVISGPFLTVSKKLNAGDAVEVMENSRKKKEDK